MARTTNVKSKLALLFTTLFLATGCPKKTPETPGSHVDVATGPRPLVTSRGFRVSDADDDGQGTPTKLAVTKPMTDAETKALFARMPAIPAAESTSFAMRAKSLPTPRPGKTVQSVFPPPPGPPPATVRETGPVKVQRKQPEGAVELAPYVTVTFSEPMAPVTSQDELAKLPVPVTLTPQPAGEWRWLGTQTVMFAPAEDEFVKPARMPMSTDYTVSVAPGAKSASGKVADAASWSFQTPTAKLVTRMPEGGSQPLRPFFFLQFDQQVDEASFFSSLSMRTGKGKGNGDEVKLRKALPAEWADDPAMVSRVENAEKTAKKGRFFVLRAEESLTPATSYTVKVAKGLKSAEGPKPTPADQTFSFSTYDKFRLTNSHCGYQDKCPPRTPFSIEFNNTIDGEKFDESLIKVTPAIPQMKVQQYGSTLVIQGRTKGRTKYTVNVGGALADQFGQTLGEGEEVTFKTGTADPDLVGESDPMLVVDPSGKPVVSVFSVNEKDLWVRVYAVTPSDYAAYSKWRRDWDYERKDGNPPGRLVFDKRVTPAGDADDLIESFVDLTPALKDNLGHAIVVVQSTRPQKPRERDWMRVWAQATKMGIDLTLDPDGALAWVTELGTGKAVAGAEVSMGTGNGKTDKDGLVRLDTHEGYNVIAKSGNDVAMLAQRYVYSDHFSFPGKQSSQERFFVFDDRKTYKPGEKVMLKGWLRNVGMDKQGDVARTGWSGRTIDFSVRDSHGADLGKSKFTVDDRGEFDFSFDIPKNANLGGATIMANTPMSSSHFVHSFDIQEFRTPEFEVTASASDGPFFSGTHAIVTTKAAYYAGGGLPNADTTWNVSRSDAQFTPPNRSDYVFGKHEYTPWWYDDSDGEGFYGRHGKSGHKKPSTSVTWTGKTSSAGTHRIRVDFDAIEPAYPMTITAAGTVVDVNRQAWSASTTMLVHPASVYAGVKLGRSFVRGGEKVPVDVIVTDLDGAMVSGRKVTVKLVRLDTDRKKGEVEVDETTCDVMSTGNTVRCELATKRGGQHRLTAIVDDAQGRRSQTTLTVWVLGESPGERKVQVDKLEIVADKKEYAPGDTAELLVISPFAPAEGLLTLRRGGVTQAIRFALPTKMESVKIPIRENMFPVLHAHVAVVGGAAREDDTGAVNTKRPRRPAEASGDVALSVPAKERTMTVTATPRDKGVEPGGSTTVDVLLKDAKGAPVSGGSAAVVVVDEAILALSGYKTPDPVSVFYTDRGAQTWDQNLRERVKLARDADLLSTGDKDADGRADPADRDDSYGGAKGRMPGSPPPPPPAPMQAAPAAEASVARGAPSPMKKSVMTGKVANTKGGFAPEPMANTAIAVRTNFTPLALFFPQGRSDGQGKLAVPVKVPDNLTRYRIMVVASGGDQQFGSGESAVTARLPLMVRPSAPRFLNFGDKFELPIVLQNQTEAPLEAQLVVRASNAGVEALGKKVQIAPNDRVEVRFAANAERPGTANFQIGVGAGKFADASLVTLPVWTPATTEAFATYGVIDEGAIAQPVKKPEGVVPSVGGLEITTSSTALQGLTDAVLYLVRYPYECNEQTASRMMAIASLKDVLAAFKADGMPKPEEMLATVNADIDRLKRRQDYSGGWGFWFSDPWPYLSIHVAHALSRAKDKGFAVPPETIARSLGYLRNIESHIPHWYGPEARRALIAYALYTRKHLGDPDANKAKAIFREAGGAEKMGLEALGWILPTLAADKSADAQSAVAAIRKQLNNRMTEQAGAAHFTTSYGEGNYLLLASDRRTDGVLLEALIETDAQNTIIPKLVTGLLAHRKEGRWTSTQENAFVLIALDRYFAKYENVTPDFVARAWLGDGLAAEQTFKGRSTDRNYTMVPMSFLGKNEQALTVGKEGAGRLYFRIGMQYAPENLRTPPMDRGFVVLRSYEGVDKPDDVRKDADGTWHVKAGAKVRSRVTMVAQARRYHVALVDPMPAGFEAMNPALKVTGPIPQDPNARQGDSWWWSRTWYEYDNLRDERAEAFASLLWDGVHEYVYTSRATTPGNFVVPPPKAEEMYSPEVFGRGAGDRVVVE